MSKSTASRNTRAILAALRQVTGEWPTPPKRGQGKNVDQALQAYPELRRLLEAAAQARPRLND